MIEVLDDVPDALFVAYDEPWELETAEQRLLRLGVTTIEIRIPIRGGHKGCRCYGCFGRGYVGGKKPWRGDGGTAV